MGLLYMNGLFFPYSESDEFVIEISQVKMKGSKRVSALNQGSLEVHKGEIWVALVALLFYVHGKHLRSCRDGQLT